MAFDGFISHLMCQELKAHLIGGRISKIYQPYQQEIQMVIRNQGQNYRLNGSIHPSYYRLHLTQERSVNPQQAPMFCMILRKHIENALVLDIYQVDNDRILVMELSGRDELGDMNTYHLIFELMGRHSNILLVNPKTHRIIDCIKHIPSHLNSYRQLQAGAEYQMPPHNSKQVNILSLNSDEIKSFSQETKTEIMTGKANQVIQGLSKTGSQALQKWAQESDSSLLAIQTLLNKVQEPDFCIYQNQGKVNFYFFTPPLIDGISKIENFDSLSALMDSFYNQKAKLNHVKQVSGNLIQEINHILDRNHSKLKKLDRDYQTAANAEDYRIKGELLSAYAHQVRKGLKEISLPNYYEENQALKIDLNPAKSAIENSQYYFKRYSKYRDSLKFIDQQKELTQIENDYLEGILVQLRQADIEDVEEIKAELQSQGYGGKKHKNIKKRAKSNRRPRRYLSSDGTSIYVGRNNQQNDELSLRKASKNHWWMHTKNIPGAHVIIESDHPSDQTITEAGEIAAYYSKSQGSNNVPVDLVQVKHLRKPNGAKPGFVIYEGQRTIYVTPIEETIKALETSK